jgi:hypothetical protein
MVTEKKWKILSDIGLDGHTKDGSILDINLIFGKYFVFEISDDVAECYIFF